MEAVTKNVILEINSLDRLKILIVTKVKMLPQSFDQKHTSICFLGLSVS